MLRRPQICDAPIALASFLIAVLAGSLAASNHAVHIVEVMAGANGNSNVQFIVIQQDARGEPVGPAGG
jgi:hypothetical protein